MGRRARPVELLVLSGKKHLTKKEVSGRRDAEERLRPRDDAIRPPQWLSKAARKEWRRVVTCSSWQVGPAGCAATPAGFGACRL